MAQRFTVTTQLPNPSAQQDFYNTMQTMDPTSELVGSGLQVVASQITAGNEATYWRKYSKTYVDFQTAGLTNSIELFSLPAGGVITAVKLKHSAAFTGGVISAYTLSVGIAGNLTKYLSDSNVFQAAGATVMFLSNTVGQEDHETAISIRVNATSVGANLSAATAGAVDIWVAWSVAV